MSPDEITTVDGEQYVQLRKMGTNFGFARLCASQASSEATDGFTLTASCGYGAIVKKRNEVHNELMKSEALAKLPAWQRATANIKRPRKTRGMVEAGKAQRSVLQVPVPGVGDSPEMIVNILNPVGDKQDDLRVKFDIAQIHHVIHYIADEGFDVDLQRKPRDPARPKGIHTCGDGKFIVRFEAPNKQGKRSRMVSSIDDAKHALKFPDVHDEEPQATEDAAVNEDSDEQATEDAAVNEDIDGLEPLVEPDASSA